MHHPCIQGRWNLAQINFVLEFIFVFGIVF